MYILYRKDGCLHRVARRFVSLVDRETLPIAPLDNCLESEFVPIPATRANLIYRTYGFYILQGSRMHYGVDRNLSFLFHQTLFWTDFPFAAAQFQT